MLTPLSFNVPDEVDLLKISTTHLVQLSQFTVRKSREIAGHSHQSFPHNVNMWEMNRKLRAVSHSSATPTLKNNGGQIEWRCRPILTEMQPLHCYRQTDGQREHQLYHMYTSHQETRSFAVNYAQPHHLW